MSTLQNIKAVCLIKYKGDQKYVPTIFWIHGGAFVAGDKNDVRKYATYIASHGYNVVNINYPLAPAECCISNTFTTN